MLVNLAQVQSAVDAIQRFVNEFDEICLSDKETEFFKMALPECIEHEEYQKLLNFISLFNETKNEIEEAKEQFPRITPVSTGESEEITAADDDEVEQKAEKIVENKESDVIPYAERDTYTHSKFNGPVPFEIKRFIEKEIEKGTSRKCILSMVLERFHREVSSGYLSQLVLGRPPIGNKYNEVPPEVLDQLAEDGAYVKDGFIYTRNGLLPHFFTMRLLKMTKYKGKDYTTKYLVAMISDELEPIEGGYITHKNRDPRDTRVENLICSATKVTSPIRKTDAEIDRVGEVFAKHKGDVIKVWSELFDDYGINISHSTFSTIKNKKWFPVNTDKYFTFSDVQNWDKSETYLRHIPLFPTNEDITSLSDDVTHISTDENDKEMSQSEKEDELFEMFRIMPKNRKRKLMPNDKQFIVKYIIDRFVKAESNESIDLKNLQKVCSEHGFEYQIGFLKITVAKINANSQSLS